MKHLAIIVIVMQVIFISCNKEDDIIENKKDDIIEKWIIRRKPCHLFR
jgi:hypothetical protein